MTTSNRWTILGSLSLAAALALGVVGCAASAGSPSEEATEAAAQPITKAADATDAAEAKGARGEHGPGRGRHHGPPGPDFLLQAALHELTLTDAQKTTIQGALDGLRPAERAERPARDASPFKALAAGVRAGRVDPGAVPDMAPDAARVASHQAKLAAALTTLHDTLTAEQRTTLVASVEAKAAEFGKHHRGPDAGGKADAKADPAADAPADARGEGRGKHGRGGHLGRGPGGPGAHGGPGVLWMLHDLDLTDAQKESIHKALEAQRPAAGDREAHQARFEAMRTGMKARLATFAADSFDAKAFVAPPAGAEAPKVRNHLAAELSAVLPVLTDAQRARLADRLEQPPTFEKRGERGQRGAGVDL